jgi:DNA invertase Pin-like site-specific DNA recombinase
MAREIDEAWIDEAVERHRRIEALRVEFDKAVSSNAVTVHSPDGSVEVVVTAGGDIIDVQILGALHQRAAADLAREMRAAVSAAADAARWARQKLHDEIFSDYRPLGEQ